MLGTIDTGLELLEIGGLSHSGWLTLGWCIQRFYVSQEKPSSDLCTLGEFKKKYFSQVDLKSIHGTKLQMD